MVDMDRDAFDTALFALIEDLVEQQTNLELLHDQAVYLLRQDVGSDYLTPEILAELDAAMLSVHSARVVARRARIELHAEGYK